MNGTSMTGDEMLHQNSAICAKDALQRGYHPLAGPFALDEYYMLKSVITDAKRLGKDYVLVREMEHEPTFISIWQE